MGDFVAGNMIVNISGRFISFPTCSSSNTARDMYCCVLASASAPNKSHGFTEDRRVYDLA